MRPERGRNWTPMRGEDNFNQLFCGWANLFFPSVSHFYNIFSLFVFVFIHLSFFGRI
jgi:hypothetical protein